MADISDGALKIAKENIKKHSLENRINLKKLDVLSELPEGKFDIILSNPPYIKSDVMKTLEVSEYEPHLALDGGEDGLIFYRVIAKKAYDALNSGGMLAFEIGYDQGEAVKALLEDFSSVKLYKDYGGNDRVIIAIK